MSLGPSFDQACEDATRWSSAQALFESWNDALTSEYIGAHLSLEARSANSRKEGESAALPQNRRWRDLCFAPLYRLTEQSPETVFNAHGKLVPTEALRYPFDNEVFSHPPSSRTAKSFSPCPRPEERSTVEVPPPMQETRSRFGPHFSLSAHCADGRTVKDAMIFTTRSLAFLGEFSQTVKEHTDRTQTTSRGWIYVMDPQPHGRSVACCLAAWGLPEQAEKLYDEFEVAVPGHVDTADIRGCLPLQGSTSQYADLVRNPFYQSRSCSAV